MSRVKSDSSKNLKIIFKFSIAIEMLKMQHGVELFKKIFMIELNQIELLNKHILIT